MRIEATQQSKAAGVTGAIQQAAKATGTSFQYLLATAKVESNLNPDAAAKTSSAGGLFQFIEQTWLGTIKEAGPSLGYGRYANAISRTDSGRYVVANPEAKAEILKLRQDPTANAMMAGVLTKSNAAVLSQKLGRQPTDGELYIAHFLGAKGAATLIGQSEQRPGATAASVFPNAARANRSIFFDKEGRPRNVAEVSTTLSNRFQVALTKQPVAAALAQMAPLAAPAATTRSAAVAPVAANAIAPTRAVATTNPLAIPNAGAIPPSVAGRLAAITPVSSSRSAATVAPSTIQAQAAADDLTPITSTANARVVRAYEVLSPNAVRSLSAPVSTPPVRSIPAVSVAPEAAPAVARQRVSSLEGEQVYSNPYRAAERREPVAPAVTDLWAQAAANAARARVLTGNTESAEIRKPMQRMASVAPASALPAEAAQPQTVAVATRAAASVSAEPLGLFQDSKPNVRALFTGGG